MFRWIITMSLHYRFLVMAAAVALVGFGALQLQDMQVDVFPEFAPPTVEVQTEAIGLSAEDVENLVTFRLEELLVGVPWLDSIRSKSITGLSDITLVFKRGTDIIKARQMVQERLALAYSLPNVASPPVILQPRSAIGRFMMIGISSDEIEPTELSLLARWTIKPRLTGVPGVANVAIWGQRLKQMHVQIDPDRLRSAQLTQDDIIAAAGDALWVSPLSFLRASSPGSGGWIDDHNQRLQVEHLMPIEEPADMAKIPVTSPQSRATGGSIPLGAITEVTFSHPPLIGDAIVNGEPGLILVIEKLPSVSTLEVTRDVEKALEELSRGLPGVKIDTTAFRLASYVERSISNFTLVIAIGALLVMLVMGTFLFTWRTAFISIASILLSLAAAVAVLYLTDATVNTMTLAGLVLALGVVIDDAIVDLHTLAERLRQRKDQERTPFVALIRQASLETRGIAVYTLVIISLALSPIFFMGGVSGAFFAPLAFSYLLAVVASMVVALTVTPALSSMLLTRSSKSPGESRFQPHLRDRYERALRRVAAEPRAVLVGVGLLVAVAVVVPQFMGESLIPRLSESEVIVNWTTPPGTSQIETSRITSRVSREIRSLPGVRSVDATIGRAITGDRVVGVNSSQIWVGIDPSADLDETIASIRETIEGYPGINHSLQSYLRDRVGEALTGQSHPIVVRIYGPKQELLRQKAADVTRELSDIEGLVDLRVEDQVEQPQIQVKVDLDAAGQAGVKPGDVRRSSATVFSGLVVGYLFKEQKIIEVVVWSAPQARQSLTNLRDLWIEKSDYGHVRFDDVADVDIVATPTVLRHERMAPYVDIVSNVDGRDPVAVAEEVKERLEGLAFPLEYHPELLGEYAEWEKAEDQTKRVAAAALIGILLLLQACFRSWKLALLGFLALPVSIAGGILATSASSGVISLGSIVGFLAVLGIAARSSVSMIRHFQLLEEEQGMAPGLDLVLRGARERMSPVLTSSMAIVAALSPIVFFGTIPGLEIVQPMAIAIVGGVIASTLLSLFVIPALYLAIRSKSAPEPEIVL